MANNRGLLDIGDSGDGRLGKVVKKNVWSEALRVPPGSLFVSCLRFLFLVRLVFAREDQSGYICMCNCLSRRANS